jgi:hypothetical protein
MVVFNYPLPSPDSFAISKIGIHRFGYISMLIRRLATNQHMFSLKIYLSSVTGLAVMKHTAFNNSWRQQQKFILHH